MHITVAKGGRLHRANAAHLGTKLILNVGQHALVGSHWTGATSGLKMVPRLETKGVEEACAVTIGAEM